jgi:hypothetical protein
MANRPHTRDDTVLLPSGRTIQVTYIAQPPEDRPVAALEHCDACGANRVHPLAWEEGAQSHWDITLRCPDCLNETTGVFHDDAVRRYDEVLDREAAEATAELCRLERANMREYATCFTSALQAGALLPEDF